MKERSLQEKLQEIYGKKGNGKKQRPGPSPKQIQDQILSLRLKRK